ncbi:MAG: hypothetical protein FD123_2837 [Bacteroidetes bacterium]|nr:MAG: hypothetical protein FD123_2837 [Bacteroidota bacterium]
MKTIVILGGNSGMGKATAAVLAKKKYRIIIHGRDEAKTAAALQELKSKSGNENIEAVTGDLSSVAGMKKVAELVRQKTDSIDTLILSTGVIYPKRIETADGMEMAFATQYLCRFAMTQLLMPLLGKPASARIVMVGAPTMKKAQIYFDDLSLKNNHSMMRSMGQSMLSNHLFVQEFAKRHPGKKIVINILHVGIARTGVSRELNGFMRLMVNVLGKSPDALTNNIIYLAEDDAATFSGYFLKKPGKPEARDLIQYDAAVAEKLWETSMKLIS